MKWLIASLLAIPAVASAEPNGHFKDFEENIANPLQSSLTEKYHENLKKKEDDFIQGSVRQSYKKFTDRILVPGFVSSAPLLEIARVIGPNGVNKSFRIGDTIYLQWVGTPGPREGHRYMIYTPAVVFQSILDPTDFSVKLKPKTAEDYPENFRMAGHFYEGNGLVRITRIKQGLVEAVIEGLKSQVSVGDQLMPPIPMRTSVQPVEGGIQLAAAVVSGSPVDRLSTTKRSFIYINRGSRDGIREGRMFQAVEAVPVDRGITGQVPEVSVGEAMVVYVTDSYSTAIITKQFDVIRMGSLLKTKQTADAIPSNEPFKNLVPGGAKQKAEPVDEIPNLGDLDHPVDTSLPEPKLPPSSSEPSLSELDALEKAGKFDNLTEEEKIRLGKLSRQEKLDSATEEEPDLDSPLPSPVDNSFRQGGKSSKKPKKSRAKRSNDEEELNQLMMQN